jgi:hypothetical protein
MVGDAKMYQCMEGYLSGCFTPSKVLPEHITQL